MPHKHRRGKTADDSDFGLAPSIIARPLPVGKSRENPSKTKLRASRAAQWRDDDTPRAFARLMQFKKTGRYPNGLDNGDAPRGHKRKREGDAQAKAVAEDAAASTPKILPGERLGDFAARVDQALPVGQLVHKGKQIDGARERETKHNKRLRKMQTAWRKEEARLREKEMEKRELNEEEEDERNAMFEDKTLEFRTRKGKGKLGAKTGERYDDDPWEVLSRNRAQPKGLHDVAHEPPQFKRIPTEKFKVRNGARANVADVPNAAGSLRRREELGEARKTIIEGYRRMMESKRTDR